ncbi:MAG: hypothetical protein NY202_02520 [Mollicutes bacterium UO1]
MKDLDNDPMRDSMPTISNLLEIAHLLTNTIGIELEVYKEGEYYDPIKLEDKLA